MDSAALTTVLVLTFAVAVRSDCAAKRSSSLQFRAKSSVNETKQRSVKVDVVSVARGTETLDLSLSHWTAECDGSDTVSLSVSVATPTTRTWTPVASVAIANATAPTVQCRAGFELVAGVGCYREGKDLLTWEQARVSCEADGAHLAVPNSRRELDFLIQIYHRPGPSPWVGIRKSGDEWMTTEAELFDFSGWAPGHPDGKGDCVFVWREGVLDWKCGDTLRYICEQRSA